LNIEKRDRDTRISASSLAVLLLPSSYHPLLLIWLDADNRQRRNLCYKSVQHPSGWWRINPRRINQNVAILQQRVIAVILLQHSAITTTTSGNQLLPLRLRRIRRIE